MRKLNITILVGLVVAVLGFGMVFAYGRNVDEKVADGKATRTVLVATQDIPAGTSADQLGNALEARQIPAAYVSDSSVSALSEVSGKSTLGPIAKDAQLTATNFGTAAQAASVTAGGAIGNLTPSKGKVAVAVPTTSMLGTTATMLPGSTVDLFVTYTSSPKVGGSSTSSAADRTKLFLSGVKLLGYSLVGQVAQGQQSGDQSGSSSSDDLTASSAQTVLDLTATDAERVINATQNGKVFVALSTAGEVHRTPEGASANDVLNNNR